MVFRIERASGKSINGKCCNDSFLMKIELFDRTKYDVEGIRINTLEQLIKFIQDIGEDIVITKDSYVLNDNDNTDKIFKIIIYDDYLE